MERDNTNKTINLQKNLYFNHEENNVYIYRTSDDRIILLNAIGHLVLSHCDGKHFTGLLETVKRELCDEIENEKLISDIQGFLNELETNGIISYSSEGVSHT